MTFTLTLPPQLEKLVRSKVASGQYHSAGEVVREALNLLDEHERFHAQRLSSLRSAVVAGMKSGAGRTLTASDVKKRARATKPRKA
ncbi:MAG: type II toxin-antitoxin system ParD family antitoxin [Alphaproteobacteria bacterium]|nr:type II toxin-antitoxin system ParD family antitoxin [Alphaproteobacteria bacterium]NDC56298.1 type II toxin-antitoxin system ParD family antitoxin [Alphaproteobacteria bacterium]